MHAPSAFSRVYEAKAQELLVFLLRRTFDVERVEVRYYKGPPLVGDTGDGGFVLLADAWRRLRELIAYDGTGRVLERADMSQPDTRYLCQKEPEVCPPEASSSSR